MLTVEFDWTRAINSINNTIPEDNVTIRDDCWQHHHARAATVVQGPFCALCIREASAVAVGNLTEEHYPVPRGCPAEKVWI